MRRMQLSRRKGVKASPRTPTTTKIVGACCTHIVFAEYIRENTWRNNVEYVRKLVVAAVVAVSIATPMAGMASASGNDDDNGNGHGRQQAGNNNHIQQVQVIRQGNGQDIRIRVGNYNDGPVNIGNSASNTANATQQNQTTQSATVQTSSMTSQRNNGGNNNGQNSQAQNNNRTNQRQVVDQWNDQEIRIRIGNHNDGSITFNNSAENTATANQSNTTSQAASTGGR